NNKADEPLTKNEKHIKILEKLENMYIEDLIRDIVSTEVKTKLVNLLDWFPKFRSEFIKSLKLTSFKNPALNVMSLFSRNKIIKVPGEVENNNAEIFLDTCSSVNLITKSALKKFKINKPCIGTITETFLQAFSNNNFNSSIYELSIKIGDLTFSEYFRLVDKDDIFDILIGVDSLKRNRFVINLVDDILYFIDLNNNPIKLTNLCYDINIYNNGNDNKQNEVNNDKEQNNTDNVNHTNFDDYYLSTYGILPALITISSESTTNNQSSDIKLDNLEIKRNIINNIITVLPLDIQNKMKDVFNTFMEVIAIKTDDLGKTKLLPHHIDLLPNTKPIKQRAYRLPKVKADALKVELTKLIENSLIEPSHSPWMIFLYFQKP
ncbi:hypothetical protein BCR36DRAFT_454686, partial [Piromyces finnis]